MECSLRPEERGTEGGGPAGGWANLGGAVGLPVEQPAIPCGPHRVWAGCAHRPQKAVQLTNPTSSTTSPPLSLRRTVRRGWGPGADDDARLAGPVAQARERVLVGDLDGRRGPSTRWGGRWWCPPRTVLSYLGSKVKSVDHMPDVPLCTGRGARARALW